MTRKEQIKSAYKHTGSNASFYDGMMTYSTLPGKAICRIVWNSVRCPLKMKASILCCLSTGFTLSRTRKPLIGKPTGC